MKRRSSFRRTDAPTPVAVMAVPADWHLVMACTKDRDRRVLDLLGILAVALASGARPGASGDRLDDVVVAGTATDIALELLADRLLGQVATSAVHDVDGRHDHAGGTEPALEAVMLAKRLLHRVELAV